jgi:branched-chain amino acid transport system ATP-binding protein
LGAYTKRASKYFNDTLEWVYQLFPILKERKTQLANKLSGGERQMLAIARGLMSRPKLLMLDEPSLGLAPIIADKIFKKIEELREVGVTMLLVEQNVHKALKVSNYVYVLEMGRIALSGDSETLMRDENVKKTYLML